MQSRTSIADHIASRMAWPKPPKEPRTKAEEEGVLRIRRSVAEREEESGNGQIVRTLGVYCGFKADLDRGD